MSFLGPLGNLQVPFSKIQFLFLCLLINRNSLWLNHIQTEVAKIVDSMSPNQLYEVIVQMKVC
jgi:hypothetical protein